MGVTRASCPDFVRGIWTLLGTRGSCFGLQHLWEALAAIAWHLKHRWCWLCRVFPPQSWILILGRFWHHPGLNYPVWYQKAHSGLEGGCVFKLCLSDPSGLEWTVAKQILLFFPASAKKTSLFRGLCTEQSRSYFCDSTPPFSFSFYFSQWHWQFFGEYLIAEQYNRPPPLRALFASVNPNLEFNPQSAEQ